MDNGNSLAFGSIFQAGCWDHDANASTASVPSVFKSTNDGGSWQRTALSTSEGEIKSLAAQSSNKNIMYAGGFTYNASRQSAYALFKTTNGGTNWSTLSVPGSTSYDAINVVLIDPSNANRVYLGGSQGVLVSTNGGTNWTPPTTYLRVTCLIPDGKTANKIYAGTDGNGVYVTTNGGTSWSTLNTGLTTKYIQCMDMDPVNNVLYAGTAGGGVYRLTIGTGVEDERHAVVLPIQFVLHQNYPNPFNASTEIRYNIQQPGRIRLVLSDIGGKTVRVLSDREERAGEYQTVWDGNDAYGRPVPSGIYLCRLEAEYGSTVRKMVLQR